VQIVAHTFEELGSVPEELERGADDAEGRDDKHSRGTSSRADLEYGLLRDVRLILNVPMCAVVAAVARGPSSMTS
jgi:hypothetical protein